MIAYEYRLEYGDYGFYIDNRLQYMLGQVSMAYDPDTFTLFKHGGLKDMEKWAETTKSLGIKVNIITFMKGCPVEEINRVLSTSGYLRYIINEPANKHPVS